MKAATQSWSGKKALSIFRQNPQKNTCKRSHSQIKPKKKKEPPTEAYLSPELFFYYILEFQEHPFSRTPLNGHFCSKYYRKLNISMVKKNEWLI